MDNWEREREREREREERDTHRDGAVRVPEPWHCVIVMAVGLSAGHSHPTPYTQEE